MSCSRKINCHSHDRKRLKNNGLDDSHPIYTDRQRVATAANNQTQTRWPKQQLALLGL